MGTIWDRIWENDSYSVPLLRKEKAEYELHFFENYLTLSPNSICVDIGCGNGYMSKIVHEKYKCKVFSCDSSSVAIDYAVNNNSFENSNYFLSCAEHINLPNSFADVVLCIGILEHIRDMNKALSEINRILKKGGKLVVISSNYYSCVYYDRLLKQLFRKWKYGYQKNWKVIKLASQISSYNIDVKHISIIQGMGDFSFLNKVDKVINKRFSNWGRYFQIIGVKK